MSMSLLSTSIQGISSLSSRLVTLNTYNLRLCIVKSVATGVGVIGTVSLMSAAYTTGVINTLAAIAVGSVGTLTGVALNLGADFVHKKLTVAVLQDVEAVAKEQHGSGWRNPGIQVLELMGLSDNLTLLSHTLKLLQVHALLVRLFQMNTKLVIRVAYFKSGDGGGVNSLIRGWATSDGFSNGLKWVALVSTGLVVLIDVALLVGEWQGKVLAKGEEESRKISEPGDGSGDQEGKKEE